MRSALLVSAFLAVSLLVPIAMHTHTRASEMIVGDSDCSGVVDTSDALADLKSGAGLTPLTGCVVSAGDTNCDDQVDQYDAINVISYFILSKYAEAPGCPHIGSTILPATPSPTMPSGSPTATPASSASVTQTPPTTTPIPTVTTTPTPTPTKSPSPTPTASPSPTPGQTVFLFASFYTEADEFEGTITSIDFRQTIPATGFYGPATAPSGGQFASVFMTVKNIGSSPDDVGIFSFRMRDATNRLFSMDFPDEIDAQLAAEAYFNRGGTYETIQPGVTGQFVFVFLVPIGASGLKGERCPSSGGCGAGAAVAGSPGTCGLDFASFYTEPHEFCGNVSHILQSTTIPACGFNDAQTAPAGTMFAKVLMNVRNYAKAPDDVGSFSFRLRDSQNRLFTMDFEGQLDAQFAAECNRNRLGTYETIQPGLAYDAVFVFQVPNGATGLTSEACPGSGCD